MKNKSQLQPQEEEYIWNVYKRRCVVCKAKAVTLHEEPPKSLNPRWAEEPWNRYCICNDCHMLVHNISRKEASNLLYTSRENNFPDARLILMGITDNIEVPPQTPPVGETAG